MSCFYDIFTIRNDIFFFFICGWNNQNLHIYFIKALKNKAIMNGNYVIEKNVKGFMLKLKI